ncbi:MAG: hypothetical protein HYR63_10155 [Proteobacteria bacterium]|nr:hypothetical protein [Pseudomonadota bacterium]MBI3499770.1 hypothetical protein [Pseudomonadota bacterium]
MPLSVLSALARLGVDPREEAARLAALPERVAVEALAPMIARLPGGRLDLSDTHGIASRLIKLLPQRPSAAVRHRPLNRAPWAIVWVISAVLAGAGILGLAANGELPFGKDRTSAAVSRSLAPPQVQP